jgi:hypothetical protein
MTTPSVHPYDDPETGFTEGADTTLVELVDSGIHSVTDDQEIQADAARRRLDAWQTTKR